MEVKQVLGVRLQLLLAAFWEWKILWLPLAFTLPFAFLWFPLFLRMAACAILIPGALFLHELLHVLFVPAQTIMRVVNCNGVLGLDFEGPISIERGLLIALAPHLVLWGAAFWLWSWDYLLALPFALAGLSLPADLYAWYHRSLRYE